MTRDTLKDQPKGSPVKLDDFSQGFQRQVWAYTSLVVRPPIPGRSPGIGGDQ